MGVLRMADIRSILRLAPFFPRPLRSFVPVCLVCCVCVVYVLCVCVGTRSIPVVADSDTFGSHCIALMLTRYSNAVRARLCTLCSACVVPQPSAGPCLIRVVC
jgi:hypothetical protein